MTGGGIRLVWMDAPSTADDVAFRRPSEFARAGERAEEVGGSFVHEPPGSPFGVHRHPANRIRRKLSLSDLAFPNHGEQLYGLAHIAQSRTPAGLIEHTVELGCERSRLSGDQDLAAGGF